MPRLARLDAPGVLHHVIIRGIGGIKEVIVLPGGCGTGIPIGRFGKAFGHDRSRGRVCCAKG